MGKVWMEWQDNSSPIHWIPKHVHLSANIEHNVEEGYRWGGGCRLDTTNSPMLPNCSIHFVREVSGKGQEIVIVPHNYNIFKTHEIV